jgi:L-lactate utilization protein LutB
MDELDITQEKKQYYQLRSELVIKNLLRRNINGFYAADKSEALNTVMQMIPPGALVVRGDSMTVEQLGILEELTKRNQNKVVDTFQRDAKGEMVHGSEERSRMEREAFTADIFITGTNAVTLDGKLVNTDGMGNRVAPIIFGPRKVILVIGANKIVADEESARERIRNIAAPVNAIRHVMKHNRTEFENLPCVHTGKCVDCRHENRICCATVIIEGAMSWNQDRINVVLIGEELGI